MTGIRWIISVIVLAYILATVCASVTITIALGDTEEIPAAMLAPLLLIPSIIGFAILAHIKPDRSCKHIAYLAPASLIMALLLYAVARDLSGQMPEGSGLPAIMTATVGVPMVMTYLFVWRIGRLHAKRRRIARGLCPMCAYPIGTSWVCSECGASLSGVANP